MVNCAGQDLCQEESMISAKLARVRISSDDMIQPVLLDPEREDHRSLVTELGDYTHSMIGRHRRYVLTDGHYR